jgi:predicted TIM-barrel fold metal-dependent hydrolase
VAFLRCSRAARGATIAGVIIDCHAHFDARLLPAERILAKMDAAGVDRIAIIPAMNDPLPGTPERLLAIMRTLSGSAAGRVLVEATHRALLTPEGDLKLSGKVIPIYSRPDNESVARLVASHPDRFFGWIFLNPRNNPGVLDDLERWRHVPGMIGIKLHPHWHDYRTEILDPVLRRAEELRLPVLIHLGFRKRGDFRSICARYPKLTVISAHAGFPFYKDLWAYKGEHPNLYVDLSSPYIDEKLARAAVAAMGPERCLYGTDAPYGFHEADESYDYGEIKGWVERMPVSSAARDGIFGGTFRAILERSGVSV